MNEDVAPGFAGLKNNARTKMWPPGSRVFGSLAAVAAAFSYKGKLVFGYRAFKSADGRSLTIVSVDPHPRRPEQPDGLRSLVRLKLLFSDLSSDANRTWAGRDVPIHGAARMIEQMLTRIVLPFTVVLLLLQPTRSSAQVTADGNRLMSALDDLKVEEHWIAGAHVKWRTGEPDGKEVAESGVHSHCSAFVAATSERLGVYILRPPEHSQTFLANAQSDWLAEEGKAQGWAPVDTPEEAQRDANAGMLVVAVYKTRSAGAAGHIAIVRPSNKSARLLRTEGPDIIQAGTENFASTSLRNGFQHHPGAWSRRRIRFYCHRVTWPR